MMDEYDLLRQVAADLKIKKGEKEAKFSWYARIIYSSIGRMALASLFDRLDDDTEIVSRVHFTQRVKELFEAYITIFPALKQHFFHDYSTLSGIIYEQYESEGYLYHEPYRICASIEAHALFDGVRFLRNPNWKSNVCMSGLGMYDLEEEDTVHDSIVEIFQLDEVKLSDVMPLLLKSADWRKAEYLDGTEYLQISSNFRYGYWKSKPDMNTSYSLMRYGIGEKQYALYRSQNGDVQISTLPKWQYEGGQHFLLANAMLSDNGTLPDIKYINDGNIVTVILGYLLPVAEQKFLMLYSWPHDMNCEKETLHYMINRDMSVEIFHAIRRVFEELGFHFVEATYV